MPSAPATTSTYFNPRTPRGVRRQRVCTISMGNRNFNPRTPRGVRHGGDCLNINDKLFQSTHPARGATPYWCVLARPAFHFNPRTPRGVRRDGMSAPMRGGDFNPRTPRGVRQYAGADLEAIEKISIHAPREGCDYYKSKRPSWSRYFNPRTPRGVRLTGISRGDNIAKFQSTHPARGATAAA